MKAKVLLVCALLMSSGTAIARDLWVKTISVSANKDDVRVHPANRAAPYGALTEMQAAAATGFVASIMKGPDAKYRVRDELPLFSGKYPANGGAGFLKWGKLDLTKGVLSFCSSGQVYSLGSDGDRIFAASNLKCGDNPENNALVVGMTIKGDVVTDAAINAGDLSNMKMSANGHEYVGL